MLPTRALSRIERLPPPPAEPVRSPAVAVAGELEVRIPGLSGGPIISARIHAPAGAKRAVLICHPHPLYGGSMHSPVPLSLAKVLSDEVQGTVAWARFDFRGVGESEGTYDDGRGEVDDALAVMAELRRVAPGAALSVCGHSFGSWVALRAATTPHSAGAGAPPDRVLLLAPSVRFESRARQPLRRNSPCLDSERSPKPPRPGLPPPGWTVCGRRPPLRRNPGACDFPATAAPWA